MSKELIERARRCIADPSYPWDLFTEVVDALERAEAVCLSVQAWLADGPVCNDCGPRASEVGEALKSWREVKR